MPFAIPSQAVADPVAAEATISYLRQQVGPRPELASVETAVVSSQQTKRVVNVLLLPDCGSEQHWRRDVALIEREFGTGLPAYDVRVIHFTPPIEDGLGGSFMQPLHPEGLPVRCRIRCSRDR